MQELTDSNWLALGAFDGMNRLHTAFLRAFARTAQAAGASAVVGLIDGGSHRNARLLSSPADRAEEIEDIGGIERIVMVDEEIYARPEHALGELIDQVQPTLLAPCTKLGVTVLHVANVDNVIEDIAASKGVGVISLLDEIPDFLPTTVGLYTTGSVIRFLEGGHVAAAARVLGRYFAIEGIVEHGDERGRLLGFPTANLAVPERRVLPADGVYAGVVTFDDETWPAAISLGRRSTFYDAGIQLLEAYLLGFSGDLYGRTIRVAFTDFVRGQQQFASVDELVAQLHLDVALVKEFDPVASFLRSRDWTRTGG